MVEAKDVILTEVAVVAGARLSSVELVECLSLIGEGGAVDMDAAARELPHSIVVALIKAHGRIVATGAIKRSRPEYARQIAKRAGHSLDASALELGYVSVSRDCQGKGCARQMVQRLVAAVSTRPLFATTSNDRMKRTLGNIGFESQGSEWSGKCGRLSLWLLAEECE